MCKRHHHVCVKPARMSSTLNSHSPHTSIPLTYTYHSPPPPPPLVIPHHARALWSSCCVKEVTTFCHLSSPGSTPIMSSLHSSDAASINPRKLFAFSHRTESYSVSTAPILPRSDENRAPKVTAWPALHRGGMI